MLLDVDGVLLDSASAHQRIWNAWADLRGLDAGTVCGRTFGQRPEDTVRDVAPDLDPAAEREVLNALMRREGDAFPPMEGARPLLRALRPGAWAIVTSGSRLPVHERFERAGLPLPEVQIYGEDVLYAKPHPAAYQLAATRLGIAADRCVVVEDAPAGIAAGKAAGCTVIAITSTHKATQLPGADAYVPFLAELRDHLASLVSSGLSAGDTSAPSAC
ncbi:HAD-IA family hydrolase [Streptomyces sp. BV286]|uniref:HAD-IA family hydrolase n=1 Tax=Streptomyces sp. BV286 TaxID=2849672 RepID=UPI0027E43F3B|nr:HAD-IA family hydrolase [Streptomyces sp. BV286]